MIVGLTPCLAVPDSKTRAGREGCTHKCRSGCSNLGERDAAVCDSGRGRIGVRSRSSRQRLPRPPLLSRIPNCRSRARRSVSRIRQAGAARSGPICARGIGVVQLGDARVGTCSRPVVVSSAEGAGSITPRGVVASPSPRRYLDGPSTACQLGESTRGGSSPDDRCAGVLLLHHRAVDPWCTWPSGICSSGSTHR